MEIVATCFAGLEDILVSELENIGVASPVKGLRAVSFQGDIELLYKANLQLSTALRVLVPIAQFQARSEQELYKNARDMEWERYLNLGQTFAIRATSHQSKLHHTQYIGLKVKDAIVDRFRQMRGRRPSVDPRNPDIPIQLRLSHDEMTVLLDSSGAPLFKRGYRLKTGPAPINECLAAGLIKLSGWTEEQRLYDPMCGSGTLLMEAIGAARGMGVYPDRNYAFQNWVNYERGRFSHMRRTMKREGQRGGQLMLIGADKDMQMIRMAQENAQQIQSKTKIQWMTRDFFNAPAPYNQGMIICNPPYDKRLEESEVVDFYKKIGDQLKKEYQGWTAWIFSGNPEALKHLGLRPTRRMKLYNGPLEAGFYKFEIYDGSRKQKDHND